MTKLTKQQQKTLLICLGVIVASYAVRWLYTSAQELANRQQQIRLAQQRAKAAPRVPITAVPAKPSRPVLPFLTTLSNLSGFWKGQNLVAGQGFCTLSLELREMETPANYTAYSTLSCKAPPSLWGLKGGQLLPPACGTRCCPRPSRSRARRRTALSAFRWTRPSSAP